nr:hypothetical protein [uncultured Flavobacterium sp.]
MTKKCFLFTLLILSVTGFSQEMISFNSSKKYPATPSWNFICENYALTGFTEVQIAKTEKGGLLKLAVETTNPTYTISGTAYIYLSDNTFIICSDKGNREKIDTKIVSYYSFTPIEMSQLKKNDIQSIRFTIKGIATKFNSQIGNFTAVNKKEYFATYDNSPKSYHTANEIKAL